MEEGAPSYAMDRYKLLDVNGGNHRRSRRRLLTTPPVDPSKPEFCPDNGRKRPLKSRYLDKNSRVVAARLSNHPAGFTLKNDGGPHLMVGAAVAASLG